MPTVNQDTISCFSGYIKIGPYLREKFSLSLIGNGEIKIESGMPGSGKSNGVSKAASADSFNFVPLFVSVKLIFHTLLNTTNYIPTHVCSILVLTDLVAIICIFCFAI